jgi:hypothetical protein
MVARAAGAARQRRHHPRRDQPLHAHRQQGGVAMDRGAAVGPGHAGRLKQRGLRLEGGGLGRFQGPRAAAEQEGSDRVHLGGGAGAVGIIAQAAIARRHPDDRRVAGARQQHAVGVEREGSVGGAVHLVPARAGKF